MNFSFPAAVRIGLSTISMSKRLSDKPVDYRQAKQDKRSGGRHGPGKHQNNAQRQRNQQTNKIHPHARRTQYARHLRNASLQWERCRVEAESPQRKADSPNGEADSCPLVTEELRGPLSPLAISNPATAANTPTLKSHNTVTPPHQPSSAKATNGIQRFHTPQCPAANLFQQGISSRRWG